MLTRVEHPTLGAIVEQGALRLSLAAPAATKVEVQLFDVRGEQTIGRWHAERGCDGIWSIHLRGHGVGTIYGWRVDGPWAPADGLRFNPHKLLLDPYAQEVVGHFDGSDLHLGHQPDRPDLRDTRDNAASALKARVIAPLPRPHGRRGGPLDPSQRIIYELNIRGYTALHPQIDPLERGTYRGLTHPAVLAHLHRIGVTTLCLQPVQHRADESRLLRAGLRNYWGYNPIAWSAPEARLASQGGHAQKSDPAAQVQVGPSAEFHEMVQRLHDEGFEVILDIVYNHSAESDETGPTLSLRGIDNALYYVLDPDDQSRYRNWSGCGNVLNLQHPIVLQMVIQSLRSWVSQYGVDGFRFDLATILGRDPTGQFDPQADLLRAIEADPVLSHCILIAEPWDLAGYGLGEFSSRWLEWNDRYRDQQRRWWLHRHGNLGEIACRIAGSSDVFARPVGPIALSNAAPILRGPLSSVHFITAHDGFTLHDLVSYQQRYNEANGEDNRDGHAHNLSINCGIEGNTNDTAVQSQRLQLRKAMLASLLAALGTPMILAGDEWGHSQAGNNNAYCQDNPLTWIDWSSGDEELCEFLAQAAHLRRSSPLLRSPFWWQTAAQFAATDDTHALCAKWYCASGDEPSDAQWGSAGGLQLHLQDRRGNQALLLFNSDLQTQEFLLPPGRWALVLASAPLAGENAQATTVWLASSCKLAPQSVCWALGPLTA